MNLEPASLPWAWRNRHGVRHDLVLESPNHQTNHARCLCNVVALTCGPKARRGFNAGLCRSYAVKDLEDVSCHARVGGM